MFDLLSNLGLTKGILVILAEKPEFRYVYCQCAHCRLRILGKLLNECEPEGCLLSLHPL